MIARLNLLLPFVITIPEGETFPIYEYNDEGYNIHIFPPAKTEVPILQDNADEFSIDEKPTYQANRLIIDFKKDTFDRKAKVECDPPYTLITRAVNSFLLKLRFVTRGSKIHPINLLKTSWYIKYLNDDESELEKTEGLVRGRFAKSFTFSWTALNSNIWEEILKLPADYIAPHWDNLLLDAIEALPQIGPSIVLATTALEVFISHILNESSKNSSIPKDLWNWINNRNWRLQEPTIEEQFDNLLKIILGISLKQNIDLWEAFKNLKDARNSFVHEGIAKIGQNPISEEETRRLVGKANEIIQFIKNKLPRDLQWPEYKHSIKVEVKKKIF
jgi:hypothetical protein